MMEYYKQVKESALRALGSVVEQPVEDDHESVHAALAHALKHETCEKAAKAICAVTSWKWAHHEIEAHTAVKA
jgi:hypothetical protein